MKTAIILAAHGSSKDRRMNRPMFELAKAISNRLQDVFVTPAFLDGVPDVRQIVNQIDNENLLVIPFMTSQGYYTNVVFPKAFQHPSKIVHFANAIGAQARIVDLVDSRIRHLEKAFCRNNDFEIVVVGHGTRKNKKSCRTTIELVKNLRRLTPGRIIQFAFIDQNPGLRHVASRIVSKNVMVIPFLMGLGPHTVKDVPNAFGINNLAEQVFEDNFEFPFVHSVDHGLRIDVPHIETVIYDAPIGTYSGLAQLCTEIYQDYMAKTLMNHPSVGEVA